MQKIITLIFVLFTLAGCKVPESEYRESEKTTDYREPSPGREGNFVFGKEVRWGKYVLPVERSEGTLGGIDFVEDSLGYIHAAVTIKYLDVWSGGYRYALYYFHNQFGYWTRHTLKMSQSRFYKSGGGYGENNFVRIVLDENEKPMIFTIDSS
ncbi:MAG: hypothetical protein EP319_08485, partial [Deltaproteobacteria bacterium]